MKVQEFPVVLALQVKDLFPCHCPATVFHTPDLGETSFIPAQTLSWVKIPDSTLEAYF